MAGALPAPLRFPKKIAFADWLKGYASTDSAGNPAAGRHREERHQVQTLHVLRLYWIACVRGALDESQTSGLLTNLMYYVGIPYLQSAGYAASPSFHPLAVL